jgi:hypothetical protein
MVVVLVVGQILDRAAMAVLAVELVENLRTPVVQETHQALHQVKATMAAQVLELQTM